MERAVANYFMSAENKSLAAILSGQQTQPKRNKKRLP
jgi:hypothetical protein